MLNWQFLLQSIDPDILTNSIHTMVTNSVFLSDSDSVEVKV